MTNKQVHIQYGVVTGLVIILIGVATHYSSQAMDGPLKYIAMLPLIIGVIACCIAYSKANGGYVTFGQTFGSGFKAVAIITLLTCLWTLASVYIWPETVTRSLAEMRAGMEKNKNMKQEDIDKYVAGVRDNFKLIAVGGALFSMLLFGTLFAVIGAAVAKKNGPRVGGEMLDAPSNF